jgi:hypothetical protein
MRIGVVGGGVAGVLLAWRLIQDDPAVDVEIWTGDPSADASAASGGMVRGFDADPATGVLAAESLAEIRGSATLREWAGYREVGSLYVLTRGSDAAAPVATVERMLPGSVSVVDDRHLAERYGLAGLPPGSVGVLERAAGYLSPGQLRTAVLRRLFDGGVTIRRQAVAAVRSTPAVVLGDGTVLGYDAVVVAAGAATPRLLVDSGEPVERMRTKHIQYGLHTVRLPGLGAFVDEVTGLYGRPAGEGLFLLGLPTNRWDVEPACVVPDRTLAAGVVACAARLFGAARSPGAPVRLVAAADCYHEPPGLALRACDGGLFTFTGGSGGAAKTAVAASRYAAASLLARMSSVDR